MGTFTSSSCPISAKASPRSRSSPGTCRPGDAVAEDQAAGRRDDRQGDGRDPVAGRRQGAGARRRARGDARGRLGAGPDRASRRAGATSPPRPSAPAAAAAARPRTRGSRRRTAARRRPPAASAARASRRRRRQRGTRGDGGAPIASPAVRRARLGARRRPRRSSRQRHRRAASRTTISTPTLRHGALARARSARRVGAAAAPATMRGSDPDHRPAPRDRGEDAGVEAPHPALLLCRGSRRHRARGAARAPERAARGATRPRLTLLPFLMRAHRAARCATSRRSTRASTTRPACVHALRARCMSASRRRRAHGLMVPVVRHAEALDLWASAPPRSRAWPTRRAAARRRATSSPARPSRSPASARSAASSRRR